MSRLSGINIVCEFCRTRGELETIDGQVFDPPGWVYKGENHALCPECAKATSTSGLHPMVVKTAERAIHLLQSCMATELSANMVTPGGTAIAVGSDGMARRLKRCELLARYADALMTVYGNVVGFRLASEGVFAQTTLGVVATALEDLMKAEIAFSKARAVRERKPTSRLDYGYRLGGVYNGYDEDPEPSVSGPLFRLQEVSRIAQKLAQLAVTRAGQVVARNGEDEVLDAAVDEQGVLQGARQIPGYGAVADPMRELMTMLHNMVATEEKRRDERWKPSMSPPERDPIDEIAGLLETRQALVDAGRADSTAVEAIDARILLAEARLRVRMNETAVDGALAAEAMAKDVTPMTAESAFQGEAGTHTAPPTDDEIARLRRDLGDDYVRSAFPTAFARVVGAVT